MTDNNMKDYLTGAGVIAPDWWKDVPVKRVPDADEAARKAEVTAPAPVEVPTTVPDVKIHQLHILPHPNADALELAVVGAVERCKGGNENCPGCSCGTPDIPAHCFDHAREITGGFRAVVPKGHYKTGDYAVYIPEAALLPDALIEELGLVGRLAGSGKNRVKAIRLRGELSQGIVCRPAVFGPPVAWHEINWEYFGAGGGFAENYADLLGIIKWAPRVPAAFRGKIRERGDSMILPWTDIPNIKKEMRLFAPGELVRATEKIHGTCCLITFDVDGDQLLVSSKGIAKQGWDLLEEPGNVYWRAVRGAKIEPVLRWIKDFYPDAKRIGLYGEVFGHGIQDLSYGAWPGDTPQFLAFDMRIDDMWLNPHVIDRLLDEAWAALGISIEKVPVLFEGPYEYDGLCQLAEVPSHCAGNGQIGEGLVVRAVVELADQHRLAKFINPAYLLRKGETTEFE